MASRIIGFILISLICHVRMLVGVGRRLVDERSNKKKFQQQIVLQYVERYWADVLEWYGRWI